jgi:hypothetical protein
MTRQPDLRDLVADLRRVTARLERLAARDSRTLDQMVLDCLADVGPCSTNALSRLIRRRRADVLATCQLMFAANQITRDGKKWSAE